MAVGVVMDYPGISQAQYEAVCRGLNHGNLLRSLADLPVPGILSHTAGPTPTGWRVIDVWESEDAMRRFGDVLGPQLQKQGFPGRAAAGLPRPQTSSTVA